MKDIIRKLASVKITVVCLALLFWLTFWGTIYQVNHGLFAAQEEIFNSFWFLMFGFLPFPGAHLVILVFFINLLAATYTFFIHYKFKKIGILLIHYGMLVYCLSAFVVYYATVETNVSLLEGAGTNVSRAYHDWELSIWQDEARDGKKLKRAVVAISDKKLMSKAPVALEQFPLSVTVDQYFKNADAYLKSPEGVDADYISPAGIKYLEPQKNEKEPEKNLPGMLVRINGQNTPEVPLILYGLEDKPAPIFVDGQSYNVQLRRQRRALPFTLMLKEFTKEVHPGTDTPSSFSSLVEIETPAGAREVLISMNKPLRYKNYTLYQASYALDSLRREYSTLAVVQNSGRLLPYIASGIVFLGLSIHFLGYATRKRGNEA